MTRCRHKTHWWPHWRLCFRRYMLYGGCRKHYRECFFGHTEAQRQAAHAKIVRAIASGEIPRIKVRRRDDQNDGTHGTQGP